VSEEERTQARAYEEASEFLQNAQAEILSQAGFMQQARRSMVTLQRDLVANPSGAILKWAAETYQWLDVAIEAELERLYAPISCTKGCIECCGLHILSSELEALVAALWIQEELPEEMRRVERQLRRWERRLRAFVRQKGDWRSQDDFLRDYADEHLWCPFLREDLCVIYSARPLSCRCHFVTSPSEKCGSNELVARADPARARLMGARSLKGMTTNLIHTLDIEKLQGNGTFPTLVAQWLTCLEGQPQALGKPPGGSTKRRRSRRR
jgi:Fe-S-cluster containining protein